MFLLSSIYNDNTALLKSLYQVYGPTFALKSENRYQWFLLSCIILFNAAQAILLVVTNSFLNSLFLILTPEITLTLFAKSALQYLGAVALVAISSAANVFANGKLVEHLDDTLSQEYAGKWLATNTFVGINYLPAEKQKPLNTGVFFSHDIPKANNLAVKSFDNFIKTFLQFFAGLYGLWQLSSPLTVFLFSTSITIPAIYPLGAIAYGLIYCVIISRISFKLRDITRSKKEASSQLAAQANHVDKNAEGIALLRGNNREYVNFLGIIKRSSTYQNLLSYLQSLLAWCTNINENFQNLVAIALSVPSLLAKKINQAHILSINSYFSKVVKFFTWQGDNSEDLANLTVLGDKFQQMSEQTTTWDGAQKQGKLEINPKEGLRIEELLIKKPNNKDAFLHVKNFEFNQAKITLLQGPSGVGKSSLFRALARLWPYVEGKVTFPANELETYFMPQRVFFPNKASLYDAVTYPKNSSKTTQRSICLMLKKFELAHLLLHAQETKDWSKTLSGGEQQKIALIRAIWHKPKLLFMDEPFASMDARSKALCEKNILHYLPSTTIICIDHQGDSQFYDYLVTFNNQRLSQKPLKEQRKSRKERESKKILKGT